jgi:carbonic anhydrase/acetyltransferase-like protein (isoleucine patch superfamily)
MREVEKYVTVSLNQISELTQFNREFRDMIRKREWNLNYLNSGLITIGHNGIMWEDERQQDISLNDPSYSKRYALDVNGSSYFHGFCKINNNLDVVKNLNVYGATIFSNMSGTNIDATNSNILNLTSENVEIITNLTNYGTTTLTSLNVSENTYILGNLNVSKNVNIDGILNVSNDSNINGNVNIYGMLNVSKDTTISGNTTIYKNLNVSNNANISGNTYIYGMLNVSKDTTIGGNITIYEKLNVNKDTNIYGTLNVSNNANISGNIITNGNMIVNKNLNVSGIFSPTKIRINTEQDYSSTDRGLQGNVNILTVAYIETLHVGSVKIFDEFISFADLKVTVPDNIKSEFFTTIQIYNLIGVKIVDGVNTFNVSYRSKLELGQAFSNIEAVELQANTYGGFMHGIYNASSSITTSYFDLSANSNSANGGTGINYKGPVQFYTPNLLLDGNLNITGDIYSYSDESIKDNITRLDNCLNKINNINGYSFTRKDLLNMSSVHIGLLAQEVENIYPEIVQEKNNIKSVNYPSIVAILIESIKDLNNQLSELKFNFNELKTNLLQNKIL